MSDVNLAEIGDTGLKHSWGLVQEEFLPQLAGDRAVKVYQEMGENDPVVGSVLYALQMLVRQVHWQTQGPNAGFVDDVIAGMDHTWEEFIAEALSKLQYGWSYHEIVYREFADGRVGWARLPIRSQDSLARWELASNGDVLGMWQRTASMSEVFIPAGKALHFRTSTFKNNPEGRAVLRSAYRAWWFKKRVEEIEAIGVERDLAGIPKIGVPPEMLDPSASAEVKTSLEAFQKMGRDLRNDEQACVVYPRAFDDSGNELYSVELMSGSGRRQFVTGEIIDRYSRQIAMTCLADVILLGHEKVGSFALSESKEALLATGLQAQVDEIASQLNKWALPQLFALNGIDDMGATKIVAGELRAVNLKDLAEIIWKLSMSGMALFPSESLEGWLRAALDAPAADGTEGQVLAPGAQQGQGEAPEEPEEPEEPEVEKRANVIRFLRDDDGLLAGIER